MPPVSFIGKATATITGTSHAFVLPVRSQPGDTQLAIVGQSGDFALSGTTWEQVAKFTHAATGTTVIVARRAMAAGEETVPALVVSAAPAGWKDSQLLVYRQLAIESATLGASKVDVSGSTSFPCPGRALTTYADLAIGIVVVTSAQVAVSPTTPASLVERYETQHDGKTIAAYDYLAEAVGTTADLVTTAASSQSGMAGSIALLASPVLVAPRLVPDVPGAIGFVGIGV